MGNSVIILVERVRRTNGKSTDGRISTTVKSTLTYVSEKGNSQEGGENRRRSITLFLNGDKRSKHIK